MAGSERKGYVGLHSSCTPSYTKTKGQCGREEKWLLSLQLIQNKGGAFFLGFNSIWAFLSWKGKKIKAPCYPPLQKNNNVNLEFKSEPS